MDDAVAHLLDRATMTAPSDNDTERLRIPPHSTEAEQSVLGGLLIDSSSFHAIADMVGTPDFYRHEHRRIFDAIATLVSSGQPADMLTVFERLRAEDASESWGGLSYLNDLAQSVPTAGNIVRYAEIVRERATLRRLIATCDEIATAAFNPQGRAVAQIVDEAQQQLGLIEKLGDTSRRRLPMLGMAELRETAASVRWLIKHILPADSIGMLFGASGTFKSFIALDAALHVVHGLPWMGRRTTKGPVLYLAAEGGSGLWKRVAAWHRSRRIHWQGAPFHVVPVALDLTQDAWRVVDAAQAKGIVPSLVVVDTLSQTYSGEENSANEMAAYFRELGARFRDLWHCSVMLVHHTGHAVTERPRGSSAIRANLDFLFGVCRDENEMLATLSCQKQKEADAFQDANFQMTVHDLGTDEDGDRVTSLVARHLSSAEEVQQAMEAGGRAGAAGGNQLLLQLAQNGMPEVELRNLFYRDCGKDTAEARRQAFHRARSWACRSGLLEIAQGVVILTKASGRA